MAVSVQLRSGAHTTQPVQRLVFFVAVSVQLLPKLRDRGTLFPNTRAHTTQPVGMTVLCMEYFVYILYSEKLNRFYTGTTDDPHRRLSEHNSAHYPDAYTSKGIPWTLFLTIACESSQQAYGLERYIKKMKSAAFMRKLKENPDIIASTVEKIRNKQN